MGDIVVPHMLHLCVPTHSMDLLTLGAHAQQGLTWFACGSVSLCESV